jgi:hypothetical protein
VPFVRCTRDKRGYEHIYLMHASGRRGKPTKPRLLYWFRTPPGVKVGREPFDESVRRTLEAQNPGVVFDWKKLSVIPEPPPDVEYWRERRRAEKAAKQARRADERAEEPAETDVETPQLAATSSDAQAVSEAPEPAFTDEVGADDEGGEEGSEAAPQPAASAAAGAAGENPPSGARRRRRRGGQRRRRPGAPVTAGGSPIQVPEAAAAEPSQTSKPNGETPGEE